MILQSVILSFFFLVTFGVATLMQWGPKAQVISSAGIFIQKMCS